MATHASFMCPQIAAAASGFLTIIKIQTASGEAVYRERERERGKMKLLP